MATKRCLHCTQNIEKATSSETGWVHLVTGEVKCTITPKAKPSAEDGNESSKDNK